MAAAYNTDDAKMSSNINDATEGTMLSMYDYETNDGSMSSSSSDDDSGVVMTKEMRQLTKLQTQVSKLLNKIQSIRIKLKDDKLHEQEKIQFEAFLIKINLSLAKAEKEPGNSNLIKGELKQLRRENKQIKKLFQTNKKVWQASIKASKAKMKAEKAQRKVQKQKEKLERKAIKQEKKLLREKRKQLKKEFKEKLEKARIDTLPINKQKEIELWIDGWNISGCFGGRSRSKGKLINLLQDFYTNYELSSKINGGCIVSKLNNIELFYDGNGKDKLSGNINITHSTKEIIVDDLWINLLTKKQSNHINTSNIICITSDRELTVRLYNIGVTVMKSGTFFKTYLKPLMPEKKQDNNNNNGNDAKDNSNDNDEGVTNNDNDVKMDN